MPKIVLIPQFTLRRLLLITTACAAVFSVFGLAMREHYWAAGVSIAIVSLVVAFVVHALIFAAIWVFAAVGALFGHNDASVQSPLSSDATVAVPPPGALPESGRAAGDVDDPATPTILD